MRWITKCDVCPRNLEEINNPPYKASLQHIALANIFHIGSHPLRTVMKHNNEPNNPSTSWRCMTCQIAMGNICCDKKLMSCHVILSFAFYHSPHASSWRLGNQNGPLCFSWMTIIPYCHPTSSTRGTLGLICFLHEHLHGFSQGGLALPSHDIPWSIC